MKYKNIKSLKTVLLFSILCTCITILCYTIRFYKNGIATDPQYWALFGDYIGGVLGTFFGLISILVVCWTFYKQDESQRIQQFDSSFFNLLSIQQRIISAIKGCVRLIGNGSTGELCGFEYINKFADTIQEREREITSNDNYANKLLGCYEESEINNNLLGHYFRHLYHIFEYVDNSNVPNDIKIRYMDIIQAQMTDNELFLCFINSYSGCGKERLKPLLEKYHFFEDIKSYGDHFDKFKKELFSQNEYI